MTAPVISPLKWENFPWSFVHICVIDPCLVSFQICCQNILYEI